MPNQTTILLQGDSITDCGHNRDAATTPNDLCGLGQGYAMMAGAEWHFPSINYIPEPPP